MIGGTQNVIAAAREAGVERFVLMSALGTSETTKELVPYWRAKWQMEQDVAASGLEHVILRPSFVFGKDGGVLPTFVRQVRYSPVVTVLGPGTARLQPIWVGDVAAHFARAVYLADAANRTVRARRARHRELERALPPHRRRARQAPRLRQRPVPGRAHRRPPDAVASRARR